MGDQDQFLKDAAGMLFQSTQSEADRDAAFEQQLIRSLAQTKLQKDAITADSLKQQEKIKADSSLQAEAIQADSISQNLKFKQDSTMAEEKMLQDSLNAIIQFQRDSSLNAMNIQGRADATAAQIASDTTHHGQSLRHSAKIAQDNMVRDTTIAGQNKRLQLKIAQTASDERKNSDKIKKQIAADANTSRENLSKSGIKSAEKIAKDQNDLKKDMLKVTLNSEMASKQGDLAQAANQLQIAQDMQRYKKISDKVDLAKMAGIAAKEWSPNIDHLEKNAGDFFKEWEFPWMDEGDMLDGYNNVRSNYGDGNKMLGIEQHVQIAKKLPFGDLKREQVSEMLGRFIKRASNENFQAGSTWMGDDPEGVRAGNILTELRNWQYELDNYDLLLDYDVTPEEYSFYKTYDHGASETRILLEKIYDQMDKTAENMRFTE